MNRIFDKIVFSNIPPSNKNVLWIYPIDSKHYDLRLYTIVQEDEYTCIKKWTSIGITDISKTDLTTDSWYVGTVKELNSSAVPIDEFIEDVNEYYDIVKDLEIVDVFIEEEEWYTLEEKRVYFDTRVINTLESEDNYYIVIIPHSYKINSITKLNYFEGTNSYSEDLLVEGNYVINKMFNWHGKEYTLFALSINKDELPYQITTNVIRDLEVKDFIVQETGNSIDKVMSQQSISKILEEIKTTIDNLPKESLITQELGTDSTKVISQKVVTTELNSIKNSLKDKLDLLPAYGFSNKVDTVLRVNEKNSLEWYPRNKVEVSNAFGFDDENIAISLSLATSLYFTIPKIDRIYNTDDGFNIIDEEYPNNVIGSIVYVKSTNRFLYTLNRLDFYTLWSYSSIYMKDDSPKETLYQDRLNNFYIYTNGLMSLLKEALNLVDIQKIISQELGDSENLSISLKVITDTFNTLDLKYVKYNGNPDGFTLTKDKNKMGIYPSHIQSMNYSRQDNSKEGFENDFSITPNLFCLGKTFGEDGLSIQTVNVFKDPDLTGVNKNYTEKVIIGKRIESGDYYHHDGLIIHNDKIEFFKDPEYMDDYLPTTVTGVADPTTEFDAVNKRYVELNFSKKQNTIVYDNIELSLINGHLTLLDNTQTVITNSLDETVEFTITIGENTSLILNIGESIPSIGYEIMHWLKPPYLEPNSTYIFNFEIIKGTSPKGQNIAIKLGMWSKAELV